MSVVQALSPPEGRRRPSLWLPPALSALATAMVMLLWLAPALPRSGADPLQLLSRAVMTEHARAVLWGEARPDAMQGALPRVMDESGVLLNWVFLGDQDIRLVNAQPTFLEGRRALALTYQDRDGHSVSYIIARGPNVAIPERGRVQIAKWRPLVDQGQRLLADRLEAVRARLRDGVGPRLRRRPQPLQGLLRQGPLVHGALPKLLA